jgi:hypothetical protein
VLVGKAGRCFASVAAALRRNDPFLCAAIISGQLAEKKIRDREDALASTRDACTTINEKSP